MIWRGEVAGVRWHNGLRRFSLRVWTDDLETWAYADATPAGAIVDLQSDNFSGHCGDPELDELVIAKVRAAIRHRRLAQELDELDRRRWGRVQYPGDWRRRAA